MRLKCKLCGAEFDQLAPQAVQVGNPKGSFRLYLIDGRLLLPLTKALGMSTHFSIPTEAA